MQQIVILGGGAAGMAAALAAAQAAGSAARITLLDRKVIYTQTRNRKYCSFQTCGHRMLNLRKSLKKRIERGAYTCPCCGEQFLPIRADARYCSNACRQKDYRKRKVTAHASL